MPPLECANFLECENKTVCVAPFDLPYGSNTNFSIICQKIITFHPAEFFFFFWGGVIFGQNGLECDSMWNYRRLTRNRYLAHIPENVIPGDFSQKKTEKKKKKKNAKTEKSPSTKILWSAKILQSAWILQYVYVPSCGVRCPRLPIKTVDVVKKKWLTLRFYWTTFFLLEFVMRYVITTFTVQNVKSWMIRNADI